MKNAVGLVGLGVMGRNLAQNIARNGFPVSVYSKDRHEVDQIKSYAFADVSCHYSPEDLMESLAAPKTVLLMVKAGPPVDEVIERLLPFLCPGDIVIDGGNSHFKDTMRRQAMLRERGVEFLGMGVSGGERGALNGPSLMPGGSFAAWERVRPILEAIAARDERGCPCCRYMGPDGAGHFVKMVHNGIEYADMQLIAETYFLMREALGMPAATIGQVFNAWNRGRLRSYLLEISAAILEKRDAETGAPLVEMILDRAGQKGTGKWAVQEALDLGAPVPTLADAVFSRCLSALKEERVAAAPKMTGPHPQGNIAREEVLPQLEAALYAAKISVYAQGFALLKAASDHYGWGLNLAEIASVWRGGCIIQSALIALLEEYFAAETRPAHLFGSPDLQRALAEAQGGWRAVVRLAAEQGVPLSAFASSLSYYDAYRSAALPANLLQAQRDYFGAHTYERTDRPGRFHADWAGSGEIVQDKQV